MARPGCSRAWSSTIACGRPATASSRSVAACRLPVSWAGRRSPRSSRRMRRQPLRPRCTWRARPGPTVRGTTSRGRPGGPRTEALPRAILCTPRAESVIGLVIGLAHRIPNVARRGRGAALVIAWRERPASAIRSGSTPGSSERSSTSATRRRAACGSRRGGHRPVRVPEAGRVRRRHRLARSPGRMGRGEHATTSSKRARPCRTSPCRCALARLRAFLRSWCRSPKERGRLRRCRDRPGHRRRARTSGRLSSSGPVWRRSAAAQIDPDDDGRLDTRAWPDSSSG